MSEKILRYDDGKLRESDILIESAWREDEDFEVMLKRLGFEKSSMFSLGSDGIFEIRVYQRNDTSNYFYFADMTINGEVIFVLIDGKHNYLEFLKEYSSLIKNLIDLDNLI